MRTIITVLRPSADWNRNLKPGGWIEQVEPDILFKADDGTVHPDSAMAKWGPLLLEAGEKMGHKLNTLDMMRGLIEEAGFVSTQEKVIRFPHGSWAKQFVTPFHMLQNVMANVNSPLLKEVGKIHVSHIHSLPGC